MTDRSAFGILLIDKPVGPTSHDVVGRVRRALNTKKVGHTGTLDPFASGLLVLCLGRATRIAEYLVGLDKSYLATARLGVETDSYDRMGNVVTEDDRWEGMSASDLENALAPLRGNRSQRPPVFSAVKVGGVPAHRRVRRGETVELNERPVRIDRLDLTAFDPPSFSIEVDCSSGTYIRTIAHEIGSALGTGCHLTDLRRTAVGSLSVEHAASYADLERGMLPDDAWLDPAEALGHLPQVAVDTTAAASLLVGQSVPHLTPDTACAAVLGTAGELIAMGSITDGVLKPRKVLAVG
ncbi:MAG: tRNA pseudouridine(55) synthase TruB [Longimicrobiales bacterium]